MLALIKRWIQKNRYKILVGGYKFDRLIFNAVVLLCIGYFFFVFSMYGFSFDSKIYVRCEGLKPCLNPFYKNMSVGDVSVLKEFQKDRCIYDWCKDKYLPVNFEFGEKPNKWYNLNWQFALIFFLIGLGLNHFVHNKGYKFKEIKLSEE